MPDQLWSPDGYTKAYRFAAEKHQGQLIPGSVLAYIAHPSLVCMEVIAALRAEPGHDEDFAVECALLHDVIEDCNVTFAELVAHFGPKVAAGVQALSKDPARPKADQLADSIRRIRLQPAEIWLVKLADRIVNLSPPPADWTPAKIRNYWEDAKLIHRQLQQASPYLGQRLWAHIHTYQAYLD